MQGSRRRDATWSSSAAASSAWRSHASCWPGTPGPSLCLLEREPELGAHQTGPLERRHPRRHLLRAGLAEGAALRRGRPRPLRLLRGARDRGAPRRQADRRHRRGRAAAARRARAARARERGARACAGSAPDEIARDRAARPRHRRAALPEHRGRGLRARSPRAFAEDVAAAGRLGRHGLRGRRALRRAGAGSTGRARATGRPEAGFVVVCAGAWSDRLAVAAGRAGGAADRPLPRRLPEAAPRARATWCGPASTRSPIPTCPSSAPT